MRFIFTVTALLLSYQCSGAELSETALTQKLIRQGVPVAAVTQALKKLDTFKSRVRRKDYFAIVDMTQASHKSRFYIINRQTGDIKAIAVAHGSGSDPHHTGFAHFFSNEPKSKMTSLGSYIVNEKYTGKHGRSLRLDGLEESNSKAREREIVIHQASYVADNTHRVQGRSWGCPAVAPANLETVFQNLEGGAFLYIYGVTKENKESTVRQRARSEAPES